MIPMLRKSLTDLRWTTLWYGIVAVLYTTAILAYFPYVRDNAASFRRILEAYPRSLTIVFGVTDIGSFSGFIGTEVFNLIWPALAVAFAVSIGSAVVAREVEDGTADVWLSVPAPRPVLLGGKLLGLALAIAALVAASLMPVAIGAALLGAHMTVAGVLSMGVVMAAFLLAVAAYAALFSAFSSDRGRAAGLAAGLTLAFYLAWVISRLSPDWSWLGRLSIFTAYEPQRALETGGFDVVRMALLLGIAVFVAMVALVGFKRRDVLA